MLYFHLFLFFLASTEPPAPMHQRPLASVPVFVRVCTAIFECEELKNAHGKLEALHGRLGHLEVKGAELACLQLVFCVMCTWFWGHSRERMCLSVVWFQDSRFVPLFGRCVFQQMPGNCRWIEAEVREARREEARDHQSKLVGRAGTFATAERTGYCINIDSTCLMSREVVPHPLGHGEVDARQMLLYIILCWRLEVYDPKRIGLMVLTRKCVPFLTQPRFIVQRKFRREMNT